MDLAGVLAAYAQSADDAMAVVGFAAGSASTTRVRWCNAAFAALRRCGGAPGDCAGCDPCGGERLPAPLSDALAVTADSHDPVCAEADLRREDGVVRRFGIELRPAPGEPGLWLLTAHDITDALARRAEVERQALVARHARDIVVVTDSEGLTEWANPAFYALTGFAPADVIGRRPGEMLQGPETDPATVETLRRALRAREPVRVELVNYTRDRTPYWVEMEISPVLGPSGALTHFVAVERDVTERKAAEAERAQLARRLGLAADIAGIGVWEVDLVTRRSYWDARNRALTGVAGDPAEPVSAEEWRRLIHPDDLDRVMAENEAHFRDGGVVEKRYRIVRPDGAVRHIRSIGQIVGADGPSPRAVGVALDVTDETEAARRLDAERALLRTVIDTLPDSVLAKDGELRVLFANAAMARVYAYPDGEAMAGLTSTDFSPPEVARMIDADDREVLATGAPLVRRDLHFRTGKGQPRRIDLFRAPLRDPDGRVVGVVSAGRDVSEQRALEDRLRDAVAEANARAAEARAAREEAQRERALLRALIDNLPDALAVKDLDSRITLANRTLARLTGRARAEDMVGLVDGDFLPPDVAAAMLADDRAALAADGPFTREGLPMPGPAGATHRFDLFRAPLRDAEGRIVGLVSAGRDVTAEYELREQLEDAARSAEAARAEAARERALLRAVIDNIPDAIYAKDEGARFVLKNRYDADLMGAESPDAALGKTDHDFYPAAIADAFRADDMRVIEGGETILNREERVETRHGARWFNTTKAPLRGPDGRIAGLVGIGRDVTEQHALRERLRVMAAVSHEAAQRAEAASEAKSRFLAVMSHELRTPMNGMLGLAGLLEGAAIAPETMRLVRALRDSGEAMVAILDDILDYSALDRHTLELRPQGFTTAAIGRKLRTLCEPRAGAKGLALRILVEGERGERRFGDPRRLTQMLHNLVDNAVKFSDRGVIEVRIAPEPGDRAPHGLLCTVRDQGCGMTEELAETVFQPFSQSDSSATRPAGGTGLGLAIVRGLAEAMGGSVELKTAPGQGTEVRLSLPLRRLPSRGETQDGTGPEAAPAPTALLLMPNGVERVAVRLMLAVDGWEVAVADDLAAAVERRRAGPVEVALIDLAGLDATAATALAAIREAGGPVTVVALASRADSAAGWAALDAGYDGAVAKPVEGAALRDELGRLARAAGRRPAVGLRAG